MADLSNFPITQKWVPKKDIIQLFSYPTPNGVKVSIALEMGLEYEPSCHTVCGRQSAAFLGRA
jgi:GST-like protein